MSKDFRNIMIALVAITLIGWVGLEIMGWIWEVSDVVSSNRSI